MCVKHMIKQQSVELRSGLLDLKGTYRVTVTIFCNPLIISTT